MKFMTTPPSAITPSTERKFGFFFAGVFALLSAWLWWLNHNAFFVALAVLSATLLLSTIFSPNLLRGLNRAWFRLGMMLNTIVSPVVMGVIFFFVITPYALVMRLFGRDLLKRSYDPDATSYWIDRTPPGPAPETFKNQF